jgi:hypothetical protein
MKIWDCASGRHGQKLRAKLLSEAPWSATVAEIGIDSQSEDPDVWLNRLQLRELIEHLQSIETEMIARESGPVSATSGEKRAEPESACLWGRNGLAMAALERLGVDPLPIGEGPDGRPVYRRQDVIETARKLSTGESVSVLDAVKERDDAADFAWAKPGLDQEASHE